MVKESKVKRVMLEVLNQHREGISSEEFVAEVRRRTAVSTVKVFQFIKELEKWGKLKRVKDKADARKVKYFPVVGKVEADIKRLSLIQFLESLSSPQLLEKSEGDVTVTVLFEGGKRLPIEKIDLSEVFKCARLLAMLDVDKVLLAVTVDKSR
jgi:hypothetical protein